MQVKIFENTIATQGTPRAFVRPRILGALPVRAMNRIVRDEAYRDPIPAEITLITIRALMRCAAGRIPASERAIVNGELALEERSAIRRVWG